MGVLRRDGRYVYYLVTKEKYHDKPSMSSLKAALSAMRGRIVANDVRRLAMPQIGCGLDRLAWDEVKDLILSTFSAIPLEIQVRTLSREGSPRVLRLLQAVSELARLIPSSRLELPRRRSN